MICTISGDAFVCTCDEGYYSPSGDPKTNNDCTERYSVALIGLEFTAGSDYRWANGTFQWNFMYVWNDWVEEAGSQVIIIIAN